MTERDRSTFIGGTDAAAIIGMSRWKTPLSVWCEKTGAYVQPEMDAEHQELGRELENYVAKRFMRKSGKKVVRVNDRLFHPRYDFIGAQIDRRVIGEKSILECKTCSAWKAKEWEGESIPREYIIQVVHQMAITGAERGYIAVLIGNQDFKWKVIERDEKMISDLIQKEVDFWERFVVKNVMPAVTADDVEILESIYPEAEPDLTFQLPDDANRTIELIESFKQDVRTVSRQIDLHENELKAMMGKAEYAETTLYRLRWRNMISRRFDSKRFKTEQPEIAEQYLRESTSRVFTIKPRKGEQNGDSE